MDAILAAVITQVGVIAVVVIQGRRSRKAVGELTEKVQTNHGLEPFQYLEMIGEVRAKQDHLVDLLAAHTVQDEYNFKAIDAKLERLTK